MNNIIANIRTQLQKLKCRIANLTKRVAYIEDNCCNGGGGGDGIQSIIPGDNITVDNTDPQNPVVSSTGGIESVTGDLVDNTDPLNPIVNTPDLSGYIKEPATDGTSGQVLTTDGSGGRSWTTVSGIQSIVPGDNISVDNTDPQNPIISSTDGGGNLTLEQARHNGNVLSGDIEFDSGYHRISQQSELEGEAWIDFSSTNRTIGIGSSWDYISKLTVSEDNISIYGQKKGLIGNREFDKQGDRKAFAQIADVEDAINDLVIPEQVNLTEGTNIEITGTYPNLTINSTASGGGGDTNIIESISRNGTPITPDGSKNVDIPIFSTSGAGLVPARVGAETTKFLREDGTWVTPTNTTYAAMTLPVLNTGTSTTANTISAKVLTDWLNDKISTVGFTGSYDDLDDKPNIPEQVNLTEGDNITITGTYPNLTINSTASGVETIYIELTKTQLDTAIANSELIPGVLYKITGVETWMKQGDTTKAIYLHAISTTELEKKGMGEFYVPKYNQEEEGYGIWSGELWQKTNGDMGTEPSYNKGDIVIWGGKLWKNLTDNYGTFIDHYELDGTNWEEIPVDSTSVEVSYYDVRINIIEYDYANDMITYRKDDVGNEVRTSYENWNHIEDKWFKGDPLTISNYNPIKVFQWGNEFNSDSSRVVKGVGFNIVENSVFECINQRGNIYGNTLNNAGIYGNTLENNAGIYGNTLENNGGIHDNNINNGGIHDNTINSGRIYGNNLNNGRIHDNTLNNGRIYYNTLGDNGRIYYNTLENNGQIRLGLSNLIDNKQIQYLTVNTGDIGGISGIDLSSATLVYQDYERIVFKDSTGTTKIRYYDGSGNLVVADLTD